VKIPAELLIDYDKLADYRSDTPDFSLLSPEKVGESLGAGLVLSIVVQECKFPDVGQSGYVGGRLTVRAELINVATGQRVWPAQEPGRIVNVGFESEPRGLDVAALRLSVDAARCIVRYLYDCPFNQSKIADEIKDIGWEK
jgi:hypothetical protein